MTLAPRLPLLPSLQMPLPNYVTGIINNSRRIYLWGRSIPVRHHTNCDINCGLGRIPSRTAGWRPGILDRLIKWSGLGNQLDVLLVFHIFFFQIFFLSVKDISYNEN